MLDLDAVQVVSVSPQVFALQWSCVCIDGQPFCAVPGRQRMEDRVFPRHNVLGPCSGTCPEVPHVPHRTLRTFLVVLLAGTEREGCSWCSPTAEDFVITSWVK